MIINKDRDKTEGEIQKYPQCIQHFFLSAGSEHEKWSEKKKIKHCISVSN